MDKSDMQHFHVEGLCASSWASANTFCLPSFVSPRMSSIWAAPSLYSQEWGQSRANGRLTPGDQRSWEEHILEIFGVICYHSMTRLVLTEVEVAQFCPTLCNHMDCSPSDSSVHGILQVRMLELVAIPFSRGPSHARVWTQVSCIAGRFSSIWATREAPQQSSICSN